VPNTARSNLSNSLLVANSLSRSVLGSADLRSFAAPSVMADDVELLVVMVGITDAPAATRCSNAALLLLVRRVGIY